MSSIRSASSRTNISTLASDTDLDFVNQVNDHVATSISIDVTALLEVFWFTPPLQLVNLKIHCIP
jgi:hypothetical protein